MAISFKGVHFPPAVTRSEFFVTALDPLSPDISLRPEAAMAWAFVALTTTPVVVRFAWLRRLRGGCTCGLVRMTTLTLCTGP
jgi:hypothetical protein